MCWVTAYMHLISMKYSNLDCSCTNLYLGVAGFSCDFWQYSICKLNLLDEKCDFSLLLTWISVFVAEAEYLFLFISFLCVCMFFFFLTFYFSLWFQVIFIGLWESLLVMESSPFTTIDVANISLCFLFVFWLLKWFFLECRGLTFIFCRQFINIFYKFLHSISCLENHFSILISLKESSRFFF